ncbi:MAG: YbaB/EbfC family nucleoid-associated protein [Parvibaculum sp.]|nr:YbaB/EbfC family nucleoid-associated protein [Parvibaculum sp.]MDP1626340.1 YbaB/EbfC family nucleoid-associated protein [Parvibaculum sp.]MDP2151269.1 YbaB/EbfC family nucleoid-associated protein [Parvibaculum sp.]MDP3327110.1 YbaB/EbfC family nucleoid-associated protein [Parvibaculum sp.]
MKNMLDIMKQAQKLQSRMADMQAELEAAEVEGRAGGGLVTVAMSGKGEVKKVTIDPSLMKAEEREILEDLIVAAAADAKTKAESIAAEKMKSVTGGLPLPPGLGL